MSRAVHLLAALAGAAAILLGSAPTASAVPIPSSGAHADAAASAPGATPPPATSDQPITASALVTASGADFARGEAQATVNGAVQSQSAAGGASGTNSPSQANATASWITQFALTGTNPGGAIDVDITLNVDGSLDYLNNNSGAGPGDIAAGVGVILTVYDQNGSSPAWSGTAQLATVTNPTPPALTRTGDWAAPGLDGNFTTPGCSAFSCTYDVNSTISLPDSLFVNFTDTFAVEVELSTSAFAFKGGEIDATSDFFNTGSVSLGTSTAGVGFVALVPEPALGLLLGLAALVLLSGVRRGNVPAAAARQRATRSRRRR